MEDPNTNSRSVRSPWLRAVASIGADRYSIGASAFRIGAAGTILYQYLANYSQRHYLYGPDGIWPRAEMIRQSAEEHAFSLYALSDAYWFFEVIYHLGILFTTLLMLGWHTRTMTVLTFVWLWSLHQSNPLLWDGGDNFIQIALVYAIFAKLGTHVSLDALFASTRANSSGGSARHQVVTMLHNTAVLAIAIQICFVYAVAGLSKIQGETWQNGTAIYYIMRTGDFSLPGISEHIYRNAVLISVFTHSTALFQIAFPFLFFLNRHTRRLALLGALVFHVGTAALMGLVTFASFMISAELALISDTEYRSIAAWCRRVRGKREMQEAAR